MAFVTPGALTAPDGNELQAMRQYTRQAYSKAIGVYKVQQVHKKSLPVIETEEENEF